MKAVFFVLGLVTVTCVVAVTAYLLIAGLPALKKIGFSEFLFGKTWRPTGNDARFGILPFILTSIFGTLGAIVIAFPLAFFSSVAVAKFLPEKTANVVSFAVGLLAGIPSVVYGLVGMLFLVPLVAKIFALPDGAGLFSAIIVLSVMILPSAMKLMLESLSKVPREYEDGSRALGATKTETVFKISVPSAGGGLCAALVLGVGRAVGEAMAVMMVSGNAPNMPSLFGSVRFLTTAVASEMSYSSGIHREALFSAALVLFVFIMIINALLYCLIGRRREDNEK